MSGYNNDGIGCGTWLMLGVAASVLLLMGHSFYGDYQHSQTPQGKAEEAAREKYEYDLNHSGVIERTMPDGTQLWRSRVNGQDVYFSKSGASWETSERHGKTTHTIHHNTPSTQ